MLLNCIECNHEVSEYADMCPHCGCPIDKIKEGLQTDTVMVEVVEETVVTTSFDVSKTVCPVCKTECESGAKICPICGFNELHKEFISKEDGNLWLETVVIPYRKQWENSQVDLSDFEIEGTVLKKYKGNKEIVYVPENITEIGIFAFESEKIVKIFISDNVTKVSALSFYNCNSLLKVIVSDNNKIFCSMDGVLYSKDKRKLIYFPQGRKNSFLIPEGVKKIGEYAFSRCQNIRGVGVGTFFLLSPTDMVVRPPNSVSVIESGAFKDCRFLREVHLFGVTKIGEQAFGFCSGLRTVSIPKDVNWEENTFEFSSPQIIRY